MCEAFHAVFSFAEEVMLAEENKNSGPSALDGEMFDVVFLFGFPTYGVGYFLLFIYLLFNDALGLRSCADVQCPFNLFSSKFHSIIIQRSQKAERRLYIQ